MVVDIQGIDKKQQMIRMYDFLSEKKTECGKPTVKLNSHGID